MAPPKAILFDIGGVCVASPFQAILDFESQHGIPRDWVNFAISRSAPNGAWQRIERGELGPDDAFFEAFRADLHNPRLWEEFHQSFKHRRRKAIQAHDTSDAAKPTPSLPTSAEPIPPLPNFDSTALFWTMMSPFRSPDPHIFPALLYLRDHTPFLLGALSNNINFPAGHPYHKPGHDLRRNFDVFVASAEVGMRKPAREIYELAIRRMDEFDRKRRRGGGIRAGDVVFLDDIGENLKMARQVGMRTVKVNLGRTQEAVRELGQIVGIDLEGEARKMERAKL